MRESLSLVIPAHDEAGTIAEVIEAARAVLRDDDELLVIDDGSTDDTAARAEATGVRVVSLRPNQGKGRALRRGIEEAAHDLLLFIDADGQDDPAEIPLLLDALARDVDMVIGSRFLGTLHDGSITASHRVGNVVLTGLFNRLYGCRLTDTQAGFRVVRRSALDTSQLRAVRYEIETELTLHVLRRGGRVVEVPVSRDRRPHGASGFATAYDGLRVLTKMVAGRIKPVRR